MSRFLWQLNAALRDNNSGAVIFFDVPVHLEAFFREAGPMDRNAFIATFKSLPETSEVSNTVRRRPRVGVAALVPGAAAAAAAAIAVAVFLLLYSNSSVRFCRLWLCRSRLCVACVCVCVRSGEGSAVRD